MTSFCLEVLGDFACFTRPEMKVERVSYDVITPSAVSYTHLDVYKRQPLNAPAGSPPNTGTRSRKATFSTMAAISCACRTARCV